MMLRVIAPAPGAGQPALFIVFNGPAHGVNDATNKKAAKTLKKSPRSSVSFKEYCLILALLFNPIELSSLAIQFRLVRVYLSLLVGLPLILTLHLVSNQSAGS